MAGTIPAVACFVLAGDLLFGGARLVLGQLRGRAVRLHFCSHSNPNMLYLQSTPMTEPVYLAMVCGLVFFTLRGNARCRQRAVFLWRVDDPLRGLVADSRRRCRPSVAPGDATGPDRSARSPRIAPLYWLAHNWWYYGNALEFYNGPYSHKMIYERAVQANMQRYPGDHDWSKALQYYRAAVDLAPERRWSGLG